MAIDETHYVCKIPKDNPTLWRYMDIPAFIYSLTKKSLVFVRADLFEDKYEGTLPKLTAKMIDDNSRQQINDGKLNKIYWNLSEILNKDNKSMYINCWCKENFEMIHMWKIYSKENGIAIQTTYEKLKKSIISKEKVYPTEINYIDYENDLIDWQSNAMTSFTIKRKEYKSESEFRMLISHPRIVEDQVMHLKTHEEMTPARKSLYLKTPVVHCEVDIDILITKIHISPYAPKWYNTFIADIIEKYGLKNVEIIQSDL